MTHHLKTVIPSLKKIICFPRRQPDRLLVGPTRSLHQTLKRMITSSTTTSPLVRLNNVSRGNCLYMIHPITGLITTLEPVGAKMNIPCVGIQRTPDTPWTSFCDIANFYKSCIEQENRHGPYSLLGFSLGAGIALELAQQMQKANKTVEYLIMLDGSPDWLHGHAKKMREMFVPAETPEHMVADLMEVATIMWYLQQSGPIPQRLMVQKELEKLPNLQERATFAADVLMDKIVFSQSEDKRNSLIEKKTKEEKELNPGNYGKLQSEEQRRLYREKQAIDTVEARILIEKHKVDYKFDGDIYLLRPRTETQHSTPVPFDYGLGEQCTGKVYVSYFDSDHVTFLSKQNVDPVIRQLNSIMCSSL